MDIRYDDMHGLSITLPSGHVIDIRRDVWIADFIEEEVESLLLGLNAANFHDGL